MVIPSAETTKWLGLLVAALTITVFGTSFPKLFVVKRRAHNGILLFNECLAGSQLAIFNYFLAVAITADLTKHARARYLLVPVIVITTWSYVAHVAASMGLGKRIGSMHTCTDRCETKITAPQAVGLSARYVLSAGGLAAVAVVYAYMTS